MTAAALLEAGRRVLWPVDQRSNDDQRVGWWQVVSVYGDIVLLGRRRYGRLVVAPVDITRIPAANIDTERVAA